MTCRDCDPGKKRLDDLRDLVFRHIVKRGRADAEMADSINKIGIFKLMKVVDEVVDAVLAASAEMEIQTMLASSASGG